MAKLTALVVDGDDGARTSTVAHLEDAGFATRAAATETEALDRFDGRIDVREEDGQHGLRVRGLADHSEDWRSFDPDR